MSRLTACGRVSLFLCALLACVRAPVKSAAQRPALPRATPPGLRLPAGARPTGYTLALRLDPNLPTLTGTVDIALELETVTSFLWLNATDIDVSVAQISFAGQTIMARPTLGDHDFLGFASFEVAGGAQVLDHLTNDCFFLISRQVGGDCFLDDKFRHAHGTFLSASTRAQPKTRNSNVEIRNKFEIRNSNDGGIVGADVGGAEQYGWG